MKMFPNYISSDSSNAEKFLFGELKSLKMNDWVCLHSLGLSHHIHKRESEIDFLLLGPAGIFVVEVKGGRIKRENGVWKFIDRLGRVSEKRESPFSQARSALYSIKAELIQHFGDKIQKLVFGYGVAFPDINFDIDSPEWDNATVYDLKNRDSGISDYINSLTGYWQKRQKIYDKLDNFNAGLILNYLRGDFESVRPLHLDVVESEKEVLNLTNEQLSCIDALELNDRVMFAGPAGTGKTLIAFEKLRRNEIAGVRTLFLCFNHFLAEFLKDKLKKEFNVKSVEIFSIHGFMRRYIESSGNAAELTRLSNGQKESQIFGEIMPALFKKSWKEENAYDELVIDEGQDVISDNYFKLFNIVLKNGLEKGRWSIFLDPENQKNIFKKMSQKSYEWLKSISALYSLTVNCRNTKPIAIQAECVTGVKFPVINKINGVPVKYLWYKSSADQAVQLSELIRDLISEGIKPGDIMILSPNRYSASVAGSGMLRTSEKCYNFTKETMLGSESEHIRYASVTSFKGLESPVVILTDIENLKGEWNVVTNYVGYTRARSMLIVSMNLDLKEQYLKLATKET